MNFRLPSAALAVLALTTVTACTGGDDDDSPGARVGAQYVAVAGLLTSRTSTLQTVQGALNVRVGAPHRSIVAVGPARRVEAPENGSFVPIEFEQGPRTRVPQIARAVYPTTKAWLVADGRAYRIDLERLSAQRDEPVDVVDGIDVPGALPAGAAQLAVAGTPRTLAIRIDQDGRTQSVDARTGRRDVGDASSLYADPDVTSTRSCGPSTHPARIVPDFRPCSISTRRSPWIGGKGFAPAGRTWLVASTDIGTNTGLTVTGADDLDFRLDTGPDVTFAWSTGPVFRVGFDNDPTLDTPASGGGSVAFLVPAGRAAGGVLSVTATYTLEGFVSESPTVRGVKVGQDVPVRWRTVIR